MDNFLTLLNSLNTEVILEIKIIYFWAIMSIEENNLSNAFHFFLHIKSNTLRTFSFWGEITNAQASTEYMDSMINVNS